MKPWLVTLLVLAGCAAIGPLGLAALDGAAGGTAYVIAERIADTVLKVDSDVDAGSDAGFPRQ